MRRSELKLASCLGIKRAKEGLWLGAQPRMLASVLASVLVRELAQAMGDKTVIKIVFDHWDYLEGWTGVRRGGARGRTQVPKLLRWESGPVE